MSKIVILGAGESGAGAAVLAKKEGFEVFVYDMSKIKDNYKKLMDDHNIEWEEGHHTEEKILDADEVIKSPGIPKEAPMIQKLMAKGTPIISWNNVLCSFIFFFALFIIEHSIFHLNLVNFKIYTGQL